MDFEADLSGVYTEVRRCLAVDFPHDFGPESYDSPEDNLTHVNEGYLLTLLGGLPSLHVNRAKVYYCFDGNYQTATRRVMAKIS